MVAMPIYGKNLKKSSSPEPRMPWGCIFAQIIRDKRSTKTAKIIIVHWRFTFLRRGQVSLCICMGTMYLYGKNVENFKRPPQKPYGQCCSNFMWSLLRLTFDIPDLLNYKVYNYQTFHSASPRCTDSAGTFTHWPWPIFCTPVTLTHFASTFDISSTIRPSTIKPCRVLLLNVLTWQIPWPGDLDLYFGCSDFDIIYVNVLDRLKWKTSSHQTLHSACPRCTDSAGILTWWPWPIFCAQVHFTYFTSRFSSTIRPTNT